MNNEIAAYLAAGWALCKIKPGDKGAFEPGWSTQAGAYVSRNSSLLSDWSGGVGLLHAWSGTCAIDIDNLPLAIKSFADQNIDLPGLLRAPGACVYWRGERTRLKLLYALSEPLVSVGRPQHGFELRCMSQQGTSMQDVLPPSIHPEGQPYRWLSGDWRNLPALPAELRRAWPHAKAWWPEQLLVQRAAPAPANASNLTSAAMVGAPLVAAEGQRDEFLSKALYGHLKKGGNYDESLDWLHALNREKCDPPMDDAAVHRIWRNKPHIEPDPIVIPAGPLPGAEPLVFEKLPDLPFGYEWDGNWVYVAGPPKELLYAGLLWVNRILRTVSPDGAEVRMMEVHTNAGTKRITASDLITNAQKALVNLGIYVGEGQDKRVKAYLIKSMKLAEEKGFIVDTFGTFGWHGDGFVVGDILYRPDTAPQRVALTQTLLPMAEDMGPTDGGSLAGWRNAALDMVHTANMPQAFGFLMGMAAPLMKLSGERGGMYSLLGESGQGKSSVQNAICTVWGSPTPFHTRADDTMNARMIKLSYLSNLPMVAEELTKMEPVELGNLAYSVSEGRDKDRGTQDGGLRLNVGQWHTVVVSSSNRSLLDAILMADGDAAAYRILEDTVVLPKGSKASEGDRIMRALMANQGHAGHVFAQFMVDNRERLTALIHKAAAEIADEVGASTKERIRVNMLACAVVAGAVLKASGVLPLDVSAFRAYGIGLLHRNIGSQAEVAVSPADVLQDFIDKNQAGVLRMNGDSALNVVSIQGRTAPLIMRYDIRSEELMVNQAALHKHVQDRKQSWSGFCKWLTDMTYLKRRGKHILSKGSGLPASGQVNCMILDNTKLGALDAQTDSRTPLTIAATV